MTTLPPHTVGPVAHEAVGTGPSSRPTGRLHWGHAGLAAGLLALFTFIVLTGAVGLSDGAYADNDVLLAELADGKEPFIWMWQTATFVLALLVVVFGAGLRRRLAAQSPAGSIAPDLAFAGMGLVAALTLVGGGISTEMFHSLLHADEIDPDTVGAHFALFNTMAWVWAGGALTSGAVAVAGLRHGSFGRGAARTAAVMTVLVVVTQVLPFQYLATLPITIFLLVAGTSAIRTERTLAHG